MLRITELQLVFTFEPLPAADAAGGAVASAADAARAVTVDAVNVELMPQAPTKVQLRLIPLIEGGLKITGVKWLLLGKIECNHAFELQGARLNKTKPQRKAATPVYAKDSRLELKVCRAMPLLRVEAIAGDSTQAGSSFSRYTLQAGELRKVTVRLSNVGRTANMESVTVAVSDPGFLFFDDVADIATADGAASWPADAADAAAAAAETRVSSETVSTTASAAAAALNQNHAMATLISGGEQAAEDRGGAATASRRRRHRLAPAESAEFTVWIYGAARAGTHAVGLQFYYDADPAHPASNYRTFQYTVVVDIQPTVDVSVVATAAPPTVCGEEATPGESEHQLTVEVANNGPVAMELLQLGCLSSAFRAVGDAPLFRSQTGVPQLTLEPGQKQWLQLRLARAPAEHSQQLFHTTIGLSQAAGGGGGGGAAALTRDRVVWALLCRQGAATVGWLRALAAHGEVEVAAKQFLLGLLCRPAAAGGGESGGGGESVAAGCSLPFA
eukprot:SAG22_NODE_3171_length_1881_cov_1.818743_1_plen_500_part_01